MQTYTVFVGGHQAEDQTIVWEADGEYVAGIRALLSGALTACPWTPPAAQVALPLRESQAWSVSSTCTAKGKSGVQVIKLRAQYVEQAPTNLRVASRVVDAWPITGTATLTTTTTPSAGPPYTVVQNIATTLWLAPVFGLVVRSALTGTETATQLGHTMTTRIGQHLDLEDLAPR